MKNLVSAKQDRADAIAKSLFNSGLRFISGKWFNSGNVEVKDIEAQIGHMSEVKNDSDFIKRIIDAFILEQRYNGVPVNGLWPEIEWPEIHGELPFPLDEKQLMIINRLLYHRLDQKRQLFICTGAKNTGKSTFLNIIKQLFKNDASPVQIDEFANSEYKREQALKCRLVCSDELGEGDLDCSILKMAADHDDVSVRQIYKEPYTIKCQSVFFWCTNFVPKIDVKDDAVLARIVYYFRNEPLPKIDKTLKERIYTDKELAIIATAARDPKFERDDWFEYYFETETRMEILKSHQVWKCWAPTYEDYHMSCCRYRYTPYNYGNWNELRTKFAEWVSELNEEQKSILEKEHCIDGADISSWVMIMSKKQKDMLKQYLI